MGGYGYPTRKVGLIHSMFRPSDDATIFPFLIPSNLFALSSLRNLRTLLQTLGVGKELDGPAFALETDLVNALNEHAIVTHPVYGEVFAYEADGFGNHTLMDDANVPSLLALPYLQSDAFTGDLSVLNMINGGTWSIKIRGGCCGAKRIRSSLMDRRAKGSGGRMRGWI